MAQDFPRVGTGTYKVGVITNKAQELLSHPTDETRSLQRLQPHIHPNYQSHACFPIASLLPCIRVVMPTMYLELDNCAAHEFTCRQQACLSQPPLRHLLCLLLLPSNGMGRFPRADVLVLWAVSSVRKYPFSIRRGTRVPQAKRRLLHASYLLFSLS